MLKWLLSILLLTSLAIADVLEAPLTAISFEQNPSSIEWKHILTPHFDIIFPHDIEADAGRVAHLLEKAYPFVTRSLEEKPPRIALVLQNQSAISNGFVTLAPRRSEWYLTPAVEPDLTNTEWLKTLSIHEFRHVVQFQKGLKGFNKYFYYLLGEVGQALGLGLTLPPWYFEGDAVGLETALTRGGRGRLPVFDRDLRTLLLSGKDWNYDKAHLGSYKDYVPNHYLYGYFYTTYLRNQYGDLILSKLADEAAEHSWNPLSFYNATKELTGKKFEAFYEGVMKDLIKEWRQRLDQLSPTPYEVMNLGSRFGWTNYYFPQMTKNGKVFALKRGLSFYDRFVLIDGKKEETLFYPGPLVVDYPFKVRDQKVAILERDVDPRWGYRDYVRLKVYDLNKKKMILNKRRQKWRLAILNPAGNKILMTEWDEEQQQYIVVLNISGKEIYRLPYPKTDLITSLDWINDQEVVLVQKNQQDQKSMIRFHLLTGEKTELIPKSYNNLGYVAVEEGHILFESPESGIDNIWLLTGQGPRQITSALFGAYAPTIWKNKLIYNDYTVNGMNVVSKVLPWQEEQRSENSFFPIYQKLIKDEKFSEFEQTEETSIFESKDYSQVGHALNLHSWTLLAPPLGNSVVAQAYSRDILNKFNSALGVAYNLNEQTVQGFTSLTWSHLYPVFDLRAAYGGRRQNITVSGVEQENRWEEGTASLGVSVPWNLIQGRFIHRFSMRAFANLIKVTNKISNDKTEVNDGAFYSPGIEFNYSVTSRVSLRDINPEWGLLLDGHLEDGRDITGINQKGSLRSIDGRVFLPGLWHHHSFFHQFAYEKQNDEDYQYSSFIFYPRGTQSVFLQEFTKYSGNYTLPLWYPDWNLSRYLYFKRIRLNLFYDELNGRYSNYSYRAASTGWEAVFDMNFVRLDFPIGIGVRGSYVLEGLEKSNNYEIFLATTLGTF